MASWANVLKAEAPQPPSEPPAGSSNDAAGIVVVDANAIINGIRIERLAAKVVTIPEVLAEVRDKQSRQFLSTLPFGVETREPSEESVKAVLRFARETGDIHVLSSVDLKLLALAHTLELQAHGSEHVRQHPVQAKVKPKSRHSGRHLPGWGRVANPSDWKVVDEAPDDARYDGPSSRIATQLHALDLGGAPGSQPGPTEPALGTAASEPALGTAASEPALGTAASEPAASAPVGLDALPSLAPPAGPASSSVAGATPSEDATGAAAGPGSLTAAALGQASDPAVGQQQGTEGQQGPPVDGGAVAEEGDEEKEEDAWAMVGKSRNADRRRQRKQSRWQARQQEQGAEVRADFAAVASKPASASAAATVAAAAAAAASAAEASVAEGVDAGAAASAGEAGHEAGREASAHGKEAGAGGSEAGEGEEHGEDEGDGSSWYSEGEEGEGGEDEEDEGEEDEEEGEEGEEGDDRAEEGTEGTGAGLECGASVADTSDTGLTTATATAVGELPLNVTSSVVTVTADFAMQNVLLQMGLRLVTREGQQISRLSRWALRCHACFYVTKEATRLFCPRCGNMTMERVEVTVGHDGAEFYGVRRKHCLKGTRFSLPKPKSGRAGASNPILSEDMLMMRMGKKLRRKERKAAEDDDPLVSDMAAGSWFKMQQAVAGDKGSAYTLTNWKNNPNERKNARSNRRG